MNKRQQMELETSFHKLYSNKQGLISISQLTRAYQWNQLNKTNPLADAFLKIYTQDSSIKNKQNPDTFQQLLQLIKISLLKKQENMLLDATFEMIDKDKDGYINLQDIKLLNQQIGISQDQKKLLLIFEKISDQGTKINKTQFLEIYKKHF